MVRHTISAVRQMKDNESQCKNQQKAIQIIRNPFEGSKRQKENSPPTLFAMPFFCFSEQKKGMDNGHSTFTHMRQINSSLLLIHASIYGFSLLS